MPAGPAPAFALYLLGSTPPPVDWESRWVPWPDFRLPRDHRDAAEALRHAWLRAEQERAEFACRGGRGRTGTALACIAVLDGVPADRAVAFVRKHYASRAVETPWQRSYVTHFPSGRTGSVGSRLRVSWFSSPPGASSGRGPEGLPDRS